MESLRELLVKIKQMGPKSTVKAGMYSVCKCWSYFFALLNKCVLKILEKWQIFPGKNHLLDPTLGFPFKMHFLLGGH